MFDEDFESKPIISKKKNLYKIEEGFRGYLKKYSREVEIPVQYDDLTYHSSTVPLLDKNGVDTLWETVYYSQQDMRELYPNLTMVYAILKAEGNIKVMEHLRVDRVDYCTFGNSRPFRVRIINNFNDNYDYFYVKTADASRVYGLELEHILSPNRINYLEYKDSLIEEHIAGIPGDIFLGRHLEQEECNPTRIAKEFVKFNERCFVHLLGDMRAYNFVIDMTPDFDDMQYRIRAIDFDQQCYEGHRRIYLPQYFKENFPYVELCMKLMTAESVKQYQSEERAKIASRVTVSKIRLKDLMDQMTKDRISTDAKVDQLKAELAEHHQSRSFEKCATMGEILIQNVKVAVGSNYRGKPLKLLRKQKHL